MISRDRILKLLDDIMVSENDYRYGHMQEIKQYITQSNNSILCKQKEVKSADEIVKMLNELGMFNNNVRYVCTNEDKRFVYDSSGNTRTIVRLDKIDYIQEWELTWRYDLPLDLAYEIIKFFKEGSEVDNTSSTKIL